jgi:hypothetical protein
MTGGQRETSDFFLSNIDGPIAFHTSNRNHYISMIYIAYGLLSSVDQTLCSVCSVAWLCRVGRTALFELVEALRMYST